MFIYRLKLDLACKIKFEHIKFYVTKYLRDVLSTNCFSDCTLEMDVNNNIVIIEKQCKTLESYHDYIGAYEKPFLAQISKNIGEDLISIEKYFTQIVHLVKNSSY